METPASRVKRIDIEKLNKKRVIFKTHRGITSIGLENLGFLQFGLLKRYFPMLLPFEMGCQTVHCSRFSAWTFQRGSPYLSH
jgi:hypothetical protein